VPAKRTRWKRAPLLPSFTHLHYHEMRQFLAEMGSMFNRGAEQSKRSYHLDPSDHYLEQRRYYENAAKAIKFVLDQLSKDERRHDNPQEGKRNATG